jgi:hypothetical protein
MLDWVETFEFEVAVVLVFSLCNTPTSAIEKRLSTIEWIYNQKLTVDDNLITRNPSLWRLIESGTLSSSFPQGRFSTSSSSKSGNCESW